MKNILLFIGLICISQVKAQDLSQDLLLYYPFDGDVLDYSGNENHGTMFGGAYGVDRHTMPNSCLEFNGVSDYLAFPNIESLKPELPVSFAFYIKYFGSTYEDRVVFNTSFEEDRDTGVYLNSSSTTGQYAISYGDGEYVYNFGSHRTYKSNATIDVSGQWTCLVIVVNSYDDMKIYEDGVETGGVYTGTGSDLVYSLSPGNLGRHDRNLLAPADYFWGFIDDFRYYSRALTQADVDEFCMTKISILERDEHSDDSFQVFPNPVSESFSLSVDSQYDSNAYLILYDQQAREVLRTSNFKDIDVSLLNNGLYLARIQSNGKVYTRKLVVAH